MAAEHEYSFSTIGGDYTRAVGGFVVCLLPFLMGLRNSGAFVLLAALAALFAIFLIRTILRHVTVITVTDEWIRVKVIYEKFIPWDRLTELTLSYFTTWRGGGKGWMQLRLRGAGKTVRIESSLAGFEDIALRAKEAAYVNHLVLSPTTVSNLKSFGFSSQEVEMST